MFTKKCSHGSLISNIFSHEKIEKLLYTNRYVISIMGLEWDLRNYIIKEWLEYLSRLRIVKNLDYSVKEEQLEGLFSNYGEVKEVDIGFWDKEWIGCVVMSNPSEAKKAEEALDGSNFNECTLEVCEVSPVLKRGKETETGKYYGVVRNGNKYLPVRTGEGALLNMPYNLCGGGKI
jgi:hypothetical protein